MKRLIPLLSLMFIIVVRLESSPPTVAPTVFPHILIYIFNLYFIPITNYIDMNIHCTFHP